MAYYAAKRFNYWGQLGILAAFTGAGLVLGAIASFIPLMGKIDLFGMKDPAEAMKKLLVPENAERLRWSQFLSTLFLFMLPPFLYAWVCHRKPLLHLGFTQKTGIAAVIVVILMMLACLPVVSGFQDLTEAYPWSKEMLQKFKAAEESYNRQVAVMARMNNFWDYIVAVIVIALLPAVFEEVLFRGAMQSLFSRWTRMPVFSIVLTAIIFSAVHGSYLGFLSRFALGFVLGWMYYRSGNIWLNIIAHFVNNALAVTALYMYTKPGEKVDPSKIDESSPLWLVALAAAALVFLFFLFEKIIQKNSDRPGEEVLLPGYNFDKGPFNNDFAAPTVKPNNDSWR
ncbi:MAG TPA: type II CAAX endopeptidase family protein [Ferruginibacter sp.]|nr:type II CAAX endopeptidase family protein [Ferruginibacter sp.]HMP20712.1 type II CAAX endopeptidase family protein [Ferruginibacter sp.]